MSEVKLHDDAEVKFEEGSDACRMPVRFGPHDLLLEIAPDQRVEHILAIVATKHCLLVEDIYLVEDGKDEPLDCSHPVQLEGNHRRHHVHHRSKVGVTVHYQAEAHNREFRRHAPLEQVLDWAIRVFNIDPAMAGEFELTRAGTTEELPLAEHVGHLADKNCTLELDLVRGDIANGANDA
jgi:hypothetical protein